MDTSTEEEIHLRDYLRVIMKRRNLVAAVCVAVVMVVTVKSLLMAPVYRATTQILIEKEKPKVVDIQEVLGVNTSDQDYYQTQYEILKSTSLALSVTKVLNLKDNPEFSGAGGMYNPLSLARSFLSWLKKITFSAELSAAQKEEQEQNELIRTYLDRLKVEPIRNSRLVNVSFEGTQPEAITTIVNTHAKRYIESNLERKFAASQEAVNWLNQRIREEKKNLEKTEAALQQFREREGLASVDFEERQGIIVQSLNDLNAAFTKAKTDRMEKEDLFHELKNPSHSSEFLESLPAVVAHPLIQQLKSQYAGLTSEHQKLAQKYGPEHPRMVRLSSELRELNSRIGLEMRRIAQSIETEYRVALAKEQSILSAMEEKKKEALELNRKQIEYNSLKRELETSRSMYESLLKRVKEASLTEGLEVTNIMVVDEARVPEHPVRPRKAMNLLLAVVVGLTLGVGLAFFFEYLDNTVKIPEEVERFLNLPLLGVVGTLPTASDNGLPSEIIAQTEPRSTVSEAFRTIRTNLTFSSPDEEKKVFLVTSVLPLEGKTVVSSNLAVSFSQMGKQVLLIDTDLRRPRVHTLFKIERGTGLSDLLAGGKSNIVKTAVPGLALITAGTIPPNPAELLASNRMRDILTKAKETFDVIIIDSPPVLSVTDAAELAPLAHGVILVVKASSTPRPAILRGIRQLTDVHAKVIGCVLNNVDFEKERYHYSPYHYYYQYYYHDDGRRTKVRKPHDRSPLAPAAQT